jgi:hypothetical protein
VTRSAGLPASIEQPLLAGLAKDPARRPQTASDFVETLAAAISVVVRSREVAALRCPVTPQSAVTALDCTSVTALPGPLKAALERWSLSSRGRAVVCAPGSRSTAGAVMKLVVTGTTVDGWSQNGSSSPNTTACNIIQPGTPVTTSGVGSDCGASSELDSSSKVSPTNVLMVADFQQPQGNMDVGLSYGCDDTGCITSDFESVDSSIYIGEDDNPKLVSQVVNARSGVNRLVLAIEGNQVPTGPRHWSRAAALRVIKLL